MKCDSLETPYFDLDVKIWSPFHYHVSFHNKKKYTGTNPNVAAC